MECCQFQGLNYATEYKAVILKPGDREANFKYEILD